MTRKSFELLIQGLYASLSKDILAKIPSLRTELGRDMSRLSSAIEHRGTSFFTIDLPAQGKHFDQCLSRGLLIPSGLPHQRGFTLGSPVPRLFRGLYLRVFDRYGVLRVDPDHTSIRFLRQLFYICKKIEMEVKHDRKEESVRSFFQVDNELRLPSLPWEEDEVHPVQGTLSLRDGLDRGVPSMPLLDDLYDRVETLEGSWSRDGAGACDAAQRVCDIVTSSLGWFDPADWKPKHGPGAVSDGRFGLGYSKYRFPYWPSKLESVFHSSELAYANLSDWAADASGSEDQCGLSPHEPPSKLICVPKTQKAPRLIASEPTAHQWAQQIMLAFFSDRVPSSPIGSAVNFRSQQANRDMALEASRTGSHATVDLSEASDRVSCWTVERVFRANSTVLKALHACRTRWVSNPKYGRSPAYHKIRKFACMGSACTFPVQSIIFACLAIGVLAYARNINVTPASVRRLAQEVQVFGDDIIIPVDGLDLLKGILGHLQLKVNDAKTFGTGKFRESCGIDAYDGHVVTPIYSMTYPEKSRPGSVSSVVESANNFFEAGYVHVAAWLESALADAGITDILTVAPGSGTFGLRRPWFSIANSSLKTRFNTELQVLEARCLQPYGKQDRLPDCSARSLLQYFTEDPPPDSPWRSGIPTRPTVRLRRGWEALVG